MQKYKIFYHPIRIAPLFLLFRILLVMINVNWMMLFLSIIIRMSLNERTVDVNGEKGCKCTTILKTFCIFAQCDSN